jgi:hypothetical protein
MHEVMTKESRAEGRKRSWRGGKSDDLGQTENSPHLAGVYSTPLPARHIPYNLDMCGRLTTQSR